MLTDACPVAHTCPAEKLLLHGKKPHLITFTALIETSCPCAQIHGAKDQTHFQQKGCHQLAESGNSIKLQQTTQITWTQMLNTDLNAVNGFGKRSLEGMLLETLCTVGGIQASALYRG